MSGQELSHRHWPFAFELELVNAKHAIARGDHQIIAVSGDHRSRKRMRIARFIRRT